MLRAYLGEFTPSPEIEDADGLDIFGLDTLSKEQLAPHAPSAADIDEFSPALGVQEQAPVKFSSSPIQQSSGTTSSVAALRSYAAKEVSGFQLLVAAVDAFVNLTEDQLLTTLTENDYQRLVAALDKLIDVIGESENHLLSLLMRFIGKLIEKYEEKSDAAGWDELKESLEEEVKWGSGLPLSAQGLEAAYSDDEPEYTTDMLIEVNPDYEDPDREQGSGLRLSAQGLEAAYSDDEPEYTTDMLVEVNPDYEKK